MLHPHTELRKVNDTVGYGVFATERIPRGTITWALDPLDHVFDVSQTEDLLQTFGETFVRYTWVTARGERILCWDFGRFVNHSCEANCYGPGGFELEIAVRDILPGEQLTSDYGTLNEGLSCECGAPTCRGIVHPAALDQLAPTCDAMIRNAFADLLSVEQPLWRWVEHQASQLEAMARNPEAIPSVAEHRWEPSALASSGRTASPR